MLLQEARDQFLTEYRLLGSLTHSNVVDIIGSGETDDGQLYLYFVMEYLGGG